MVFFIIHASSFVQLILKENESFYYLSFEFRSINLGTQLILEANVIPPQLSYYINLKYNLIHIWIIDFEL